MANQDSFIEEVTEEVRRDRLFALMRRYGWIAIVLVLALVGGAAWNEWRKANERAANEARGDAILAALSIADASGRREALAALAGDDNPDTAALIGLMVAGAGLAADQTDAALDDLAAVATAPGASAVYRDLATLKGAMVPGSALSPDDRIAQLQPMTLPGAPFRLVALEQVALAEIERGDRDAAIARLTEILDENAASQGLRRRAGQLIVALGGTPSGQ